MPPGKGKKWLYIVLAAVVAGLVVGAFIVGRLTGGGSETPAEPPTVESLLDDAIGQLIDNVQETPPETPAEAQKPGNNPPVSKEDVESLLDDYEANTRQLKTLIGRLDCLDSGTFGDELVPLTDRQTTLGHTIKSRISDRGDNEDEVRRAAAAAEEWRNAIKSLPALCPDRGQSPSAQQQEPGQEPEQESGFPVYESIFD